VTTLHDFGGVLVAFGHFLLGSHNFMVTAFGSCVKWARRTKKQHHNIREPQEGRHAKNIFYVSVELPKYILELRAFTFDLLCQG
jgi:hypothetical protein